MLRGEYFTRYLKEVRLFFIKVNQITLLSCASPSKGGVIILIPIIKVETYCFLIPKSGLILEFC